VRVLVRVFVTRSDPRQRVFGKFLNDFNGALGDQVLVRCPKRLQGRSLRGTMNQIGTYPSDLTNQQWEAFKDLLPRARVGGRRRTTDVRSVLNAILYLNRSGCAWRYLPKEYSPWRTVYDYFVRWRCCGVIDHILLKLSHMVRLQVGRNPQPSILIIGSQSVKASFGESRGYDGFKKVRGRKRHILVDTLGIVFAVRVSPANVGDVDEGLTLLRSAKSKIEQRGLRAI
jgi:putative transposase